MTLMSGIFAVFLWVWVADRASANLALVRRWSVLFAAISAATGMTIAWWYEPCGLHQLGRCSCWTMEAGDLTRFLYACSKLMQLKSTRKKIHQVIGTGMNLFRWHPDLDPPERYTTGSTFRGKIQSLLLAPVGEGLMDDSLNDASDTAALLKHCNGDITVKGRWSHFCRNRQCCKDEASSKRTMGRLCENVFSCRRPNDFLPQRWAKISPFLRYMGKAVLIYGMGSAFFLAMKGFDQTVEVATSFQALNGVRFAKVCEFLQDPACAFKVVLMLTLQKFVDQACFVMFGHSSVCGVESETLQKSKARKARRKRKQQQNPDSEGVPAAAPAEADAAPPPAEADAAPAAAGAAAPPPQPPDTQKEICSLLACMQAIDVLFGKLWRLVTSDPDGDMKVIWAYAAQAQANADSAFDDDALNELAATMIFRLIGEVYLRFIVVHRTYPYKLLRLHTTDDSFPSEADLRETHKDFVGQRECCRGLGRINEAFHKLILVVNCVKLQGLLLYLLARAWWRAVRAVSLPEEYLHAVQRRKAGHKDQAARTFWRSSCSSMIACVRRRWHGLGFRDLRKATPQVIRKWKYATKKKVGHTKYKRPTQRGQDDFKYAASQLTRAERRLPPEQRKNAFKAKMEEYNAMSEVQKQAFLDSRVPVPHASPTSRKRKAPEPPVKADRATPFGLGDPEKNPLPGKSIEELVDRFRGKSYEEIVRMFEQEGIAEWIPSSFSPDKKIRYLDLAVSRAKSQFCSPIPENMHESCDTWLYIEDEIQQHGLHDERGCNVEHYGYHASLT